MSRKGQYFAGFCAASCALTAGTLAGWSAASSQHIVREEEYGFGVTFEEFGWISSIIALGAIPGCILMGFLLDKIGRKTAICLHFLPYSIGYLVIIPASCISMLMAGRFILGFAVGAVCVAIPVYIGEISEREIRGTLGTFFQATFCFGVLVPFCLGPFISLFALNCIVLLFPLLMGVPMLFMPETPIYLNKMDKKDEARKALIWLRGPDTNPDAILQEYDALNAKQFENNSNPFTVLKPKGARRAVFIAVTTMIFQQGCGVKPLLSYTTEIFRMSAGFIKPEFATIFVGFIQFIAVIVAMFVIDKAGRRFLLFVSAMGMSFCAGILGLYFFLKIQAPDSVNVFSAIPIISVSMFVFFQKIGFAPIAWILIGEMFSPEVKGIGSSICSIAHWILSFLVSTVFLTLSRSLGLGPTFWLFGAITVISAIFTAFCVVETKGLNQAEIIDILEGKSINL